MSDEMQELKDYLEGGIALNRMVMYYQPWTVRWRPRVVLDRLKRRAMIEAQTRVLRRIEWIEYRDS